MSARARWLLRLYPRAWRERYEDEFVAMLEQQPTSLLDLLDILLGALDAHLRPQSGDERTVMVSRMRTAMIGILCAYTGFVVAGLGFQKMTEYEDFVEAAQAYTGVGLAFDAVVAGSVVALLAVVIGGLPIAFSALKRAVTTRCRGTLLLFVVPPLALAAFVGYTLLLVNRVYAAVGPLAVHEPLNVALFLSWVGVFLLAAVASTAAVAGIVVRGDVGEHPLRFALGSGAVAVLAMCVMLVATVVWGLSLREGSPRLFNGDDGILATSTAITWLAVVTVMALSTGVAGASVIRGLAARTTGGAVR